jgi:hypothetical protein
LTSAPITSYGTGISSIGLISELIYRDGRKELIYRDGRKKLIYRDGRKELVHFVETCSKGEDFVRFSITCVKKDVKKKLTKAKLRESKLREM